MPKSKTNLTRATLQRTVPFAWACLTTIWLIFGYNPADTPDPVLLSTPPVSASLFG